MNHYPECTCQESLCETVRGFSAHHPDSVIYQTSLMSALLSGARARTEIVHSRERPSNSQRPSLIRAWTG